MNLTIGFDDRLAQGGQETRDGNWTLILRPGGAVHPHVKLPGRKGRPHQQHLQVLISAIILDRNSQVGFHNHMLQGAATKVSYARGRASTAA